MSQEYGSTRHGGKGRAPGGWRRNGYREPENHYHQIEREEGELQSERNTGRALSW